MTQNPIFLQKGVTGIRVSILQQKLKDLNLDVGEIDGIFGAKTEAAVIKFQQSYNHLVSNGLVDAETIFQLDKTRWLKNKKPIREGSTGDEVKILQRILVDVSFAMPIDGIFGAKTKANVIEYQKIRHHKVDGIVGQETWIFVRCILALYK